MRYLYETAPPQAGRLLRLASAMGLALVVLFMLLQAITQWAGVASVQTDRFDGLPGAPFEDYVVFHAAAELVSQGRGADLYSLDVLAEVETRLLGRETAHGVLVYLNPPFLAAILAPLGTLKSEDVGLVLMLIALASVLLGGLALSHVLGLRAFTERGLFWLWFLSLAAIPWLIAQGQFSMFPLLGLLLFYVGQSQGQERLSGVGLTLVLIKPHLVLIPVCLLIWKRQWKALGVFGIIASFLVAVSILVSGVGVLHDYPALVLRSATWEREAGVNLANMFGISGLMARILGGLGLGHTVLSTSLSAGLLVATLALFRGPWEPHQPRFFGQAAAVVSASLLMSAHLYLQDLALLALALSFCLIYSKRSGRGYGWWPAWAVVIWFVELYGRRLLIDNGINLPTPVMLLFFGAIWWDLTRNRRPHETSAKGAKEESLGLALTPAA